MGIGHASRASFFYYYWPLVFHQKSSNGFYCINFLPLQAPRHAPRAGLFFEQQYINKKTAPQIIFFRKSAGILYLDETNELADKNENLH